MYRLLVFVCLVFLLNGCSALQELRLAQESPEESPPSGITAVEKPALFAQPYIDPLTDYLIEHQDQQPRPKVFQEIERERDRRCAEIARQYAGRPATRSVLDRFNLSYAYSCPHQVSAFERRVQRQLAEDRIEFKADQPPEAADPDTHQSPTDQLRSECYLLASIRNFTEARKVCLQPAENGDARAQANMALVSYGFEDYAGALTWARMAAPESGPAAFLLGQMYAAGQGVRQNMQRAVYWYREAARQGHIESRAIIRLQSQGTPADER